MPRKVLKIRKFDGGLNSHSDPLDLDDNQFASLNNANISNVGKISIMGQSTNALDSDGNVIPSGDTPNSIEPGYGLHSFKTDKKMSAVSPIMSTSLTSPSYQGIVTSITLTFNQNNWVEPEYVYDANLDDDVDTDGSIYGTIKSSTDDLNGSTGIEFEVDHPVGGLLTYESMAAAIKTATDGESGLSATVFNYTTPHFSKIRIDSDQDVTGNISIKFYADEDRTVQIIDGSSIWLVNFGENNTYENQPHSISATFPELPPTQNFEAELTFSIPGDLPAIGYRMLKLRIAGTTYDIGDGAALNDGKNEDTNSSSFTVEVHNCITNNSGTGFNINDESYGGDDLDHNGGNIKSYYTGGNVLTLKSDATLSSDADATTDSFDISFWDELNPGFNGSDEHIISVDSGGEIESFHDSTQSWDSSIGTLEVATKTLTECKASMYSAEGAVRICNSNFSDITDLDNKTYKPLHWGFFRHRLFPGSSIGSTPTRIKWTSDSLMPTTEEVQKIFGINGGTATQPSTDDYDLINLCITKETGGGGEIPFLEDTYKFYGSLMLDQTQETEIVYLHDPGGAGDAGSDNFSIAVSGLYDQLKIDASDLRIYHHANMYDPLHAEYGDDYPYPKRMTGFKVYFAKLSEGYGTKYLLFESDLVAGEIRIPGQSEAASEFTDDTDEEKNNTALSFTEMNATDTFDEENWDTNVDKIIHLYGWKASVLVGNRVFLGNVEYSLDDDGGTSDNGITHYGDRILFSPSGKYDTFHTAQVFDVSSRDGDEITSLNEYDSNLLVFSNDKMVIVNVTDKLSEQVIATHNYKGVSSPNHVCKTIHGVAWVNKFGAFLYDGDDEIKNLIDSEEGDKGARISKSDWEDFLNEYSILGYDGEGDNLILKKSSLVDTYAGGSIYMFNFKTKSWIYGVSVYHVNSSSQTEYVNTNFITRSDGKLLLLRGSSLSEMQTGNPSYGDLGSA